MLPNLSSTLTQPIIPTQMYILTLAIRNDSYPPSFIRFTDRPISNGIGAPTAMFLLLKRRQVIRIYQPTNSPNQYPTNPPPITPLTHSQSSLPSAVPTDHSSPRFRDGGAVIPTCLNRTGSMARICRESS
jgi:hypothetical protein